MASGPHSMMPKGAAANLAIGGAGPVATLSGKLAALASTRPAGSFRSRGRVMRSCAFSGSGAGHCSSLVSALSSSSLGASSLPSAPTRRAASSAARGSGTEKRNASGRSGMQGAWAFSRSQLNSAVNLGRT